MKRFRSLVLLAALVAGTAPGALTPEWQWLPSVEAATAATPTTVRGTAVQIVPPAGFLPAENFAGYINRDRGASVMVTEVPGPYDQIVSGFNEEGLKSRGMTLVSKQMSPVGKEPGLLIRVTQTAQGLVFEKWVLTFGDSNSTVMVNATWPKEYSQEFLEPMKAVVLSARRGVRAPLAAGEIPTEGLTYTVAAVPGLKFAARVQNGLVFSPTGSMGDPSGRSEVFIAAQALSNVDIEDRAAFSRDRLEKTEAFTGFKIEKEQDVVIAGLMGREILATATDRKTGAQNFIFQTILFAGQTYYIMQGMVDSSRKATAEPLFRKIAQTFKLK